ncbi:MAG: glycosyltransferase [Phycisphaerae bacterium]|nr:glycosyltransferase [Phycisphaerae bacterium]NIP53426.1 glycosyltransferase [Phycisphaerae bacterium]NIS52676.1 glycosyltransferase [Phycisphaerae bacterium]NIU09918.1 glycosyltransferase [Phycisphaerae bacterium]NIU57656.1 glycosyltransferase [Phycisphaerae bacterium]
MAKGMKKKVAFISSFPPRKCGIATFTSDLIKNAGTAAKGQFESLVVAMRSDSTLKYNDPVKFEIRQDVKSDYICAADYINFSHVEVVSVQHEFGLFGGEAGSYLSLLLNRLKAPVITTLHTLLDDPDPVHHKSLVEVCNASYKIITMNERGLDMLRDIYEISGKKVELIAHGIPDLPFVDSNYYKHKFGMENRRTILTFGLLNKNKGIEVMLKAMPRIIEAEPTILYIVLGMTHPSVLKHEGESYRFRLQRMVKELGLQEHVIFHNRFVNDEELHNFLCAADIYVTPYLNPEQLTSGTLSFAVGTGKAVVSTPYWAAMELLADGRGKLVQFGNSEEIAESIIEILNKSSLFYSLRRRAYDYGRARTWPTIGQAYWKLFSAKRLPVRITAKMPLSAAETISSIEVPEPSLDHFKKLTDDTGMFQHATLTVPNREYGYTTDDNARAVIAMADYYFQYPEPEALELFDIYLSFILHSQNNNGTVRNFMNFDRSWLKDEPLNDALGRVLWAFGTVMAKPPESSYLSVIKDSFDKSVKHVKKQYPRGMAYSILGMSDYLKQFPGASDIKRQLEMAADELVLQYENNSFPDWQWFEDTLTYDNAVLPHALYVASLIFGNKKYAEVADKTREFLLETTFNGDHFSFVGCKGWYEHGQTKATFDQQPIEAVSTVMMLRAAYDATGNDRFLTLQRKAFDWFLGENDLHTPLYNFRTKGCYDGLTQEGVNLNQGAESTLSFLLSILAVVESYALLDKVSSSKSESGQSANSTEKANKKKAAPIKNIAAKDKIQRKQVEKLT